MRTFVLVMAFALLFVPAFGGPPPDSRWSNGMDLSWAFPEPSPDFPPEDNSKVKHVPGSSKSYTQGQIDDIYNPPDWYPDEHMPFPRVVASGEGKATPGCASCHLASGSGHPESANLTGLTADYLLTQLHDFQQGLRTDPRHRMSEIAKGMTEEEVKEAAAYFASLKPRFWIRVVETDTVPETYMNEGRRRYVRPGGKMEPIGSRVIEVPEDPERVTCRDPHTGFVAYVPTGSIAKGEQWPRRAGERRLHVLLATAQRSRVSGLFPELPGILQTTSFASWPGFRSAPVIANWTN